MSAESKPASSLAVSTKLERRDEAGLSARL